MAAAQALKERGNGCFARKQYAEVTAATAARERACPRVLLTPSALAQAAIWYGSAIEAAPADAALWSNRAAALAALEKARRRLWRGE
jgi:hypothetical protein